MRRYHNKAFPPYRYTPGENPHPVVDPNGHSYEAAEEAIDFDPQAWQKSEQFLYGIDLINAEYYWEAHEVFEGIWHSLGRQSADARMMQACILAAVAALHQRRKRLRTAAKVARTGMKKIQDLEGEMYGVSLQDLKTCFERCIQEQPMRLKIVLNGIEG
jgi:hypothetical protein